MSFSKEIKNELCNLELNDCCAKAKLSALFKILSSVSLKQSKMLIVIRCFNPSIARRIKILFKQLYNSDLDLKILKNTKLKKEHVYELVSNDDVKDILIDLGIYNNEKGFLNKVEYRIIKKNCCARAYLAGVFLACGSCNSPKLSNYHLEFAIKDEDFADHIISLLARFKISAKKFKRRNQFIIYFKKSDKISDFLKLIGSLNALWNFEEIRVNKDFILSLNRLSNCENANELKILQTAKKHEEMIHKVYELNLYPKLDIKLKEIVDLRMAHPEASLNELCKEFELRYHEKITKSGLNHRFTKLEKVLNNYK